MILRTVVMMGAKCSASHDKVLFFIFDKTSLSWKKCTAGVYFFSSLFSVGQLSFFVTIFRTCRGPQLCVCPNCYSTYTLATRA